MRRLFSTAVLVCCIGMLFMFSGCAPLTEEQKAVVNEHKSQAVEYMTSKYPNEVFTYKSGGFDVDWSGGLPYRNESILIYDFVQNDQTYAVKYDLEYNELSDNFQVDQIKQAYVDFIAKEVPNCISSDVLISDYVGPYFDGDLETFGVNDLADISVKLLGSEYFSDMFYISDLLHSRLEPVGCYNLYVSFIDPSQRELLATSYTESERTTSRLGYIINLDCDGTIVKLYVQANPSSEITDLAGVSPYISMVASSESFTNSGLYEYQLNAAIDTFSNAIQLDDKYERVFWYTGSLLVPKMYYLNADIVDSLPGVTKPLLQVVTVNSGASILCCGDYISTTGMNDSDWGVCFVDGSNYVLIKMSDLGTVTDHEDIRGAIEDSLATYNNKAA